MTVTRDVWYVTSTLKGTITKSTLIWLAVLCALHRRFMLGAHVTSTIWNNLLLDIVKYIHWLLLLSFLSITPLCLWGSVGDKRTVMVCLYTYISTKHTAYSRVYYHSPSVACQHTEVIYRSPSPFLRLDLPCADHHLSILSTPAQDLHVPPGPSGAPLTPSWSPLDWPPPHFPPLAQQTLM